MGIIMVLRGPGLAGVDAPGGRSTNRGGPALGLFPRFRGVSLLKLLLFVYVVLVPLPVFAQQSSTEFQTVSAEAILELEMISVDLVETLKAKDEEFLGSFSNAIVKAISLSPGGATLVL